MLQDSALVLLRSLRGPEAYPLECPVPGAMGLLSDPACLAKRGSKGGQEVILGRDGMEGTMSA